MPITFHKTAVVPIDTLSTYENNARIHSDEQIENVMRSMEKFGFTNPVLVCEATLRIVAGHCRVLAARRLGLTEVPIVHVPDLDEAAYRQLVLADNKIALNSSWDFGTLEDELRAMSLDSAALAGFSEAEYMAILAGEDDDSTDDDGEGDDDSDTVVLKLTFTQEQYDRVVEVLDAHCSIREVAIMGLLKV